jgi:hypothetical protein
MAKGVFPDRKATILASESAMKISIPSTRAASFADLGGSIIFFEFLMAYNPNRTPPRISEMAPDRLSSPEMTYSV